MKRSRLSSLHLLYLVACTVVLLDVTHVSSSRSMTTSAAPSAASISKNITVDVSGDGDFTSIQAAVDSIPTGNTQWVRIFIKRGTYKEKVRVPQSRPFILMEGEGAKRTVIQWGDYVGGDDSRAAVDGGGPVQQTSQTGTFTVRADNFVARGITFQNTYSEDPSNPQTQAVAALIDGDKVAFYSCDFIGFQDTLCDNKGRHYFHDCYIEGFVDFIYGSGQSIYELCNIWVQGSSKPSGYITAQGRGNLNSSSAFVFKQCTVTGAGQAFLGRAWGTYPFVLFYKTYMSKAVNPLGWDPDKKENQENSMTFGESDCFGPGSDLSSRVKWAKKFTGSQIEMYTSISFIDAEGWLEQQPGATSTI